jgi:hypothetical protein
LLTAPPIQAPAITFRRPIAKEKNGTVSMKIKVEMETREIEMTASSGGASIQPRVAAIADVPHMDVPAATSITSVGVISPQQSSQPDVPSSHMKISTIGVTPHATTKPGTP